MDYHALEMLRRAHPAWRLLAADHAPLVAGFLHRCFIEPNVRTLSQPEIAAKLEDYLYDLRQRLGEGAFPRSAADYLDDWAANERGWLRKYYPPNSDEAHFDVTPATERAIDWLTSLPHRTFVGTESRLMMVFELLRQMAEGTELDPNARIAELERRRARIDAEIHRLRQGELSLMEPAQIKDRFVQMASMARGLLSDFREVEQSFRDLDRAVRERIASWEGSKSAVLQDVFGERDAISESDQGKSFSSFWDFLMSLARQAELSSLLDKVFALAPVQELEPDRRLLRIHFDWLAAGEVTQRTVARLSEQLRRYLDDRAWLENKRIIRLIRDVEQHALAVRQASPEGTFMEVDDPAPSIELPMERRLFAPPVKPVIQDQAPAIGHSTASEGLFDQDYVDKTRLAAHIRRTLQTRAQVSLVELLEAQPLEQGLAELVAYLSLAADDPRAVIENVQSETISWVDRAGTRRIATMPVVVFNR
jgi:hypothetical protein